MYWAAGQPTLARLVDLAEEQVPPLKISDSTLSSWLNGATLPASTHHRYFLVLVAFLQGRATQCGADYRARPQGWWSQLLAEARKERSRGGRPAANELSTLPPGPVTLPPAPAGFTGRLEELDRIRDWLDPGGEQVAAEAALMVFSTVSGMGGVGKTALVLQAAHDARERGWFPGGILFADLLGYSTAQIEAGVVAERFLRALGVRTKDLPSTADEKIDAWRLQLENLAARGRPLLVVLDNVRTSGQISRLLPAAPHRALVTSRHTLALSARRIDLAPLGPAEALQLLDRMLRDHRAGDDRVTTQRDDALRLAKLCGYLPLALWINGALLRDEANRPLAHQAVELEDAMTRLDALAYDDVDSEGRSLAVRASFQLSYQHLTPEQAQVFRMLSAAPGHSVSTTAAAVLLDRSAPPVRRLLRALAQAHLVQTDMGDSERWTMHDLIRLFSDELGRAHAGDDDRDTAVTRLLGHYLDTATEGDAHLDTARTEPPASGLFADRDGALEWMEAERANLIAAVEAAVAHGHDDTATQLALALAGFLTWSRALDDCISMMATAVMLSRRHGNRQFEGVALSNLGSALVGVRRFDEAVNCLYLATEAFEETGDRYGQGLTLLHFASVLRGLRQFEKAFDVLASAVATFRSAGYVQGEARAWEALGSTMTAMHKVGEAVECHTMAVGMFREIGDRHGEALGRRSLGTALAQAREFDDAVGHLTASADVLGSIGDTHGRATALGTLGSVLVQAGRCEEAVEHLKAALDMFRRTDDRYSEATTLNHLGTALMLNKRVDEAVGYLTGAAALFRAADDRHSEAQALGNLGNALLQEGRYEEAVEHFTIASDVFRTADDRRSEAQSQGNLGSALMALGRLEEAVQHHTAAAGVFRALGDLHGEAKALGGLGSALRLSGRPDEAVECLTRAARLFGTAHDRLSQAITLELLGKALMELGRHDEGSSA
ncbi:tetratricopeptide repeat protein [Streptomyces sp. NPDC012746]|uniref:tetratricopeptide repeat protein n=1 Tax=Streptomyces sp. NPDC012746 TaxID=3364845 RepID=UPI0036CB7439